MCALLRRDPAGIVPAHIFPVGGAASRRRRSLLSDDHLGIDDMLCCTKNDPNPGVPHYDIGPLMWYLICINKQCPWVAVVLVG